MYCAKKQNTESNKKVPRESKNAGSIYNVSNSVRKCHKKWQGWEDLDLKGIIERGIQNGSECWVLG